jgi:pyruvate formate lyase activating enzyme
MIIKGIRKFTLVDYPGKIAAVLFLPFCNFRCRFCYNLPLLEFDKSEPTISEKDVLDFLESRKGKLDAVCITGGEPTLHEDLPDLCKKIKELGFLVKVNTNGTNPGMLKYLIDNKLVDYISMDLKAPLDKYEKVVGVEVDIEPIKDSIKLLKESEIDYCFRTTTLPCLHSEEDFIEMAKLLKGAKKYEIQQFNAFEGLIDESLNNEEKYSDEEINGFKKKIEIYLGNVEIAK